VSGKTARVKGFLSLDFSFLAGSFSTAKDSWLREARKKRRAKKIFMVDEFWG
jgi:hypothetical protein